ncbi:MAG: ABC transporter substrate-binding protein [Alicyclobacillus shizuokensis]|nr:ABC transporter substrate-binding protein [Alicyclobacillus shizuokensis]
MQRNWKVGVALGTVAGIMLALAGCASSGNQGGSGSGQSTAASGGKAATMVMVPSPYGSFQRNFNPFQSSACNGGTIGLIYEPMFYYNRVGPQRYPLLGKSTQWSHGNKTLTVTLRSGVKWSDGQKFSASDVVYTFNLIKNNPALDTSGVWQELKDVKAQGDDKVVFDFKRVDVPFALYILETPIVPEHIWKHIKDPKKDNNPNPVGTGPYVLSSFSSQSYTLKANPNYYLGKPPVPEIEFPAYSSNDSLNLALANGQVTWASCFFANIDKVYTSKSPHNKYWSAPNNDVQLVPNLKNPILNNLTVRKAISMAINRSELIQKGEYGLFPAAHPTGVLMPTMKQWLDPNLPKQDQRFTYDPQKAVRLLEQAGFKKNKNGIFETPDGEPLSFSLLVVSGWTDWIADAQLLMQDLRKIGIQLQVEQQQYGGYMSALQNHKFDLALVSTGNGPNPYYIYKSSFATGAVNNYGGWSDPATDQALREFASTTDKAAQKQALYKVERIIAEKMPTIILFEGPALYEYNDSDYTGWPTASNPYATPAAWAWPAPEIVLMHLKPRS